MKKYSNPTMLIYETTSQDVIATSMKFIANGKDGLVVIDASDLGL